VPFIPGSSTLWEPCDVAGLIASHLDLPQDDVRKVRLAGLLHDVGHSALSHAVEGVLSRNPEIQPTFGGKRISRHEEFTRQIIVAHPFGEKATLACEQAFGNADELFSEVSKIASGGSPPLGQIIAGDLDADRIDFLLRDSHHSGVNLGIVDTTRSFRLSQSAMAGWCWQEKATTRPKCPGRLQNRC